MVMATKNRPEAAILKSNLNGYLKVNCGLEELPPTYLALSV